MNEYAESSVETAGAVEAPIGQSAARVEQSPYAEAMACLREAGVPFALLRDEPGNLEANKDVDLLIDDGELKIAFAALQRAGFVQRVNRRLQRKWVFVRYRSGRFFVLDVHGALIQRGIVYMDAKLALSRLNHDDVFPKLSREDFFLHLLLHNLLGKPRLQTKHVPQLKNLHKSKLNKKRMQEQSEPFGIDQLLEGALGDLNLLTQNARRWEKLRKQVQRQLLRYPGNRSRAWRYRKSGWFSRPQQPVILALLGPDGTGKTSMCDALEKLLADGPLRAGRVYMGSWGHDRLPMRFVRRLIPPRVSHGRIFAARRRRPVQLTALEQEQLQKENASKLRLGLRAARYALKNSIFYFGIALELGYRYYRFIKRSRRPLVITDRYVYDLEFRQGREPFTYGERTRQLIYRLFPAPDGIIYLSVPYSTVAARKAQLEREQFQVMDRCYRKMLKPRQPLEMVTDVPCEELAKTFVERFWEDLLHRSNERA